MGERAGGGERESGGKSWRGREGEWVRGRRATGRLSDPPSPKATEDRLSDLAKRQNLELIYHSTAIYGPYHRVSQGKMKSGGKERYRSMGVRERGKDLEGERGRKNSIGVTGYRSVGENPGT